MPSDDKASVIACECGAKLDVPAGIAGRRGKCARCGRSILIPSSEEAATAGLSPPTVGATRSPRPRSSSFSRNLLILEFFQKAVVAGRGWINESPGSPLLGFFISLTCWLVGIRREMDSWFLLHYVPLAGAVWCLSETIRRLIPGTHRRWPWFFIQVVLIVGVVISYGQYDEYEERWTSVDSISDAAGYQLDGDHAYDPDLRGRTYSVFTDFSRRWDNSIGRREMRMYDTAGECFAGGKGPITRTHKLHGQWTFWRFRSIEDCSREDLWYWYGEKISEGEWHLRNRD